MQPAGSSWLVSVFHIHICLGSLTAFVHSSSLSARIGADKTSMGNNAFKVRPLTNWVSALYEVQLNCSACPSAGLAVRNTHQLTEYNIGLGLFQAVCFENQWRAMILPRHATTPCYILDGGCVAMLCVLRVCGGCVWWVYGLVTVMRHVGHA